MNRGKNNVTKLETVSIDSQSLQYRQHCQRHPAPESVYAFRQNPQFFTKFSSLRLLYQPPSAIRAKFGRNSWWIHGVLYRAKYHIYDTIRYDTIAQKLTRSLA